MRCKWLCLLCAVVLLLSGCVANVESLIVPPTPAGDQQAIKQALDDYENELIDFCASRGVTFFTVSSDEPIEKVIFGKGYEAEVIK